VCQSIFLILSIVGGVLKISRGSGPGSGELELKALWLRLCLGTIRDLRRAAERAGREDPQPVP
jgi:hypothetical protein